MDIIKIMLVDDHRLIREGIRQLLEIDKNLQVVGEADDGFECLEKIEDIKPDIILLDINMPNINGMEVLKELKSKKSSIKVLILTVHNELEYIINAVHMGADGYILKNSNSTELKEAIVNIVNGEIYIQPSLRTIVNSNFKYKNIDQEKLESLTKRESEILTQVASGMSNKEIAINLDISERTVKNHLSNIFKKIDVSDRTQAAIFAIKNNIVKL